MSGRHHAAVEAGVARLDDELRGLREDLHRHPELSWAEHRTTQIVAERLAAAGLEPVVGPTGTGVICELGHDGPVVALRADIDALPIEDAKAVPYRSTVAGACHACGHDVHTAVVMGAGLALAELLSGPGSGRVRLIFQPAEEQVPGGASGLVAAGVMDGVSAIFALHCDPSLEVGRLGVSPGPITSAADLIEIRLHGPGGHTARPHQSVDLVHLAGKVAVDLPAGLARMSDARDALNLTFGMIGAGDAPNVIPTTAVLRGSLRAGGRASWEAAGPKLRALLTGIVEPHGARWELDHAVGAPPIVNDRWATTVMAAAAAEVLGTDAVGPTVQSGGGEDFSWYLDHAPGCYARLGVRPAGAPVVDIHSAGFDVDPRVIGLGARVVAATALAAIDDLAVSGPVG